MNQTELLDIDPRFAETEFMVEADGFAQQSLWESFSEDSLWRSSPSVRPLNWIQDLRGLLHTVGLIGERPIVVCCNWARLNGHLVMFYNGTSQIVDWVMIEEWLNKVCSPKDEYGGSRRCDAMNFQQCYNFVSNK